jgi:3',5'-cyclic AMP phosphodiesterase CpdA
MKILHISDTHFHAIANNDALLRRFTYIQSNYPDHKIIITGDITDDGTEEQYAIASRILKPFKGRLFFCPGNHDYGTLGSVYTEEAARRFDEFAKVFNEGAFIDKVPLVFKIENVQIILLNSNLKTGNPLDFACGEIGKGQLKILRKILKENLPKDSVRIICLHHHPFIHSDPTMKLLDAEDFVRVIYGKTDILLFGHKHEQAQWLNKVGCKFVLASGALFEGLTAKEITIDGIGISVASVPIVWGRGGSKKVKMPQAEIDMEAIKEIKKRKKRSKQRE